MRICRRPKIISFQKCCFLKRIPTVYKEVHETYNSQCDKQGHQISYQFVLQLSHPRQNLSALLLLRLLVLHLDGTTAAALAAAAAALAAKPRSIITTTTITTVLPTKRRCHRAPKRAPKPAARDRRRRRDGPRSH
jgi:hypothetical protein